MDFLDTNLIVYANDRRDPNKQARALEIIRRAIQDGSGVISVQVMQEYANTALNKLEQESGVVLRQLALLQSLTVVIPEPQLVMRAVEMRTLFQLSFWDASILAAAEIAGCKRLISEDLSQSQAYGSLRVVNPFLD